MKKALAILMGLLILATSLVGCGVTEPEDSAKSAPSTDASLPENENEVYADTLVVPGAVRKDVFYSDISEAFRQSLWTFAAKTSGAALEAESYVNSLYSPLSLYYALAMLEAGAAGATKADLRGLMAAGEADIGEELSKLYALMAGAREGSIEQVANALWIKRELLANREEGLKDGWLDQMANHFYASAFAVDFTDPETSEKMSRWVEDQTKGKIKPQIDVSDPLLLLVLMNTLYFKAEWADRFDPGLVNGPFYGDRTMNLEASYLSRLFKQHPAVRTDRFVSTQVPLKNGFIEFILPAKGLTPEDLLEDPAFLTDLREEEPGFYDIDFKLPQFTYNNKIDILEKMASLGLTATVTDNPDFSAMYDGEIRVSGISQEAFISLDEKGIEAAAYTEVFMADSGAPQETELIEIHLNRPFIYVISDQAGAPLFVGIIRNPGVTVVES
ncbi:MAG TPA: serpin family protein [Bacillota bacterium]|jgi:serine protease inhibitor|nr:serpin family protein [Fastidiosipila sp.]HPX92838.1 serpin family protein [Bacillota bacterium]HQB81323.1 serpin family protein [Bacillota bacterium]